MSDRDSKQTVEVTFGDQTVVVRRSGKSGAVIANVLGSENDPTTGVTTVWLDRKVHRSGEKEFVEGETFWRCSGAISTVLTRH